MKSKEGIAAKVAELLKDSTSECPECGASVPNGDSYCPECGHKMQNVEKSASPDRLRSLHAVIGELIGEGGKMSEATETSVEKSETTEETSSEETTTATTEDEVLKSVPEAVRALIAKEREQREELQKQLSAEVTLRETNQAIAKARDWSSIGIEAEEFGKSVQKLRAMDPELAAVFEKALDGAQAVAQTSKVFESIGTSLTKSGSTLDQLTRAHMEKNAGDDYATAQAAVLDTPEGIAAYDADASEKAKG